MQVPFGAGIKTLTAYVAEKRCRSGLRSDCRTAMLSLPQRLFTAKHLRANAASKARKLWAPLPMPEVPESSGTEKDPQKETDPQRDTRERGPAPSGRTEHPGTTAAQGTPRVWCCLWAILHSHLPY